MHAAQAEKIENMSKGPSMIKCSWNRWSKYATNSHRITPPMPVST